MNVTSSSSGQGVNRQQSLWEADDYVRWMYVRKLRTTKPATEYGQVLIVLLQTPSVPYITTGSYCTIPSRSRTTAIAGLGKTRNQLELFLLPSASLQGQLQYFPEPQSLWPTYHT